MSYPIVLYWVLLALSVASKGPGIFYLFFASWSFGSLAVIPPELTGGASLTPAWVTAAALSAKVCFQAGLGTYMRALTDMRRFGWLTLCTAYAVVSALILPRLFQGQADVIVMRLLSWATPEPLGATSANVTQPLYFVLTTATTVSLYLAAVGKPGPVRLLAAFRFGAVMALLTGAADLVASQVGRSDLLTPFRNATYVMMTENRVMDLKRVVGLTPEASTYAELCISFLALLLLTPSRPQALGGGRTKWALVAALGLAVYLSTSSGGFVSLAVLLAICGAVLGVNLLRMNPQAWRSALVIGAFGLLAGTIIAYHPELISRPVELIDALVFKKTASSSYEQRSMWNQIALQAFLHTDFLGAGLGSVRASGWIYAIIGNIGLPGALTVAAFLIQLVMGSSASADRSSVRLLRAAKLAMVPGLVLASLSSTSVGFGLGVAWLAALVVSLARPPAPARATAGRPSLERPFALATAGWSPESSGARADPAPSATSVGPRYGSEAARPST